MNERQPISRRHCIALLGCSLAGLEARAQRAPEATISVVDRPDTGSFDIPEPLVTKLIGLGLAGYPTISVSRVSVGADEARPELVLLVSENKQRAVDTGVKSCQEDSECTAPEVCEADRSCH